jgi:4-methyl-5(b-hydroxyethyl)-thiazole monophosphate biosynthesis
MKKILLLLAEGFEMYEASVFIDVIGWNLVDGNHKTKLVSCGLKKEVKSSFNQKIIVDYIVDEININDFDALALPGGFEEYGFYNDAYNDKFLEIIKGFKRQNKIIVSICVGALPLGKGGILFGKRGTTYNKKVIRQETLKSFGVKVISKPIVIDDNVITSWNPSTAINVAFLLLELLTTKENADYVKGIMGFK